MFQVPQQEEEPIDLEKRIENMIQYQNNFNQSNLDCTQSINRLEALMSQLNDAYRVEETLPYQNLTNSDYSSHIDNNKISWCHENFN